MAQATAKNYDPIKSVQYLSHFPTFEINFIFERLWCIQVPDSQGTISIFFLDTMVTGLSLPEFF
jgi:hypothetical protein